jgi:hypothetical protein
MPEAYYIGRTGNSISVRRPDAKPPFEDMLIRPDLKAAQPCPTARRRMAIVSRHVRSDYFPSNGKGQIDSVRSQRLGFGRHGDGAGRARHQGEKAMTWENAIATIALIFSVICFVLFLIDTLKKPTPEVVADRVQARVAAAKSDLDPRILGELAKALAAAFSKIGPGLVALIGSILFLLLSGEAAQVYHLTGTAAEENAADADEDSSVGNTADEAGNEANESGNAEEGDNASNAADNGA